MSSGTFVGVCVRCVHGVPAPSMHRAAQWDLSADSGGAGTAWDKWAAFFDFHHPLALMSFD